MSAKVVKELSEFLIERNIKHSKFMSKFRVSIMDTEPLGLRDISFSVLNSGCIDVYIRHDYASVCLFDDADIGRVKGFISLIKDIVI
mgnify:CR=1 FL=1